MNCIKNILYNCCILESTVGTLCFRQVENEAKLSGERLMQASRKHAWAVNIPGQKSCGSGAAVPVPIPAEPGHSPPTWTTEDKTPTAIEGILKTWFAVLQKPYPAAPLRLPQTNFWGAKGVHEEGCVQGGFSYLLTIYARCQLLDAG
ncbi:hypothetical protein DPEC_G00212100 [Dallia pectoralis]|uniref:Uncharacterized protein n=1 Tax=Dallia pectoralis TaxID=75939 RepID=A0ACC2G680_DALPE|nr:hypothetical protein DPEC_G00212100 [Dallia pectoralis]